MSIDDIRVRKAAADVAVSAVTWDNTMTTIAALNHSAADIPKLLEVVDAVEAMCESLLAGQLFEASEMDPAVLNGHRSAALHVLAAIRTITEAS